MLRPHAQDLPSASCASSVLTNAPSDPNLLTRKFSSGPKSKISIQTIPVSRRWHDCFPTINRFFTLSNRDWVRVAMQKQTISKRSRLLTCQQDHAFAPKRYSHTTWKRTSSGSCSSMHDNKDKLTLRINQQSTTVAFRRRFWGKWLHKVESVL